LRRLSDTLAHLAALRDVARTGKSRRPAQSRLASFTGFGSNPGQLNARLHVPEGLTPGAALVVVLHGCTQTAENYDTGAGWSTLADRHGFAVLYPEQQRSNNANLCFNWFEPGDTRRDAGEAGSIAQMIAHAVEPHAMDPARIHVTGLSAGGAMAATMLALYPEVFASGAVIAGLPHGVASGVQQALERMRGQGLPTAAASTGLVREASSHSGPWPALQVWHGTADRVVAPANGEALLEQWRPLHGLAAAPDRQESIGAHMRRVWTDRSGRAVLEHYAISGLGHGTPLAATGPDALGAAGPHMLEAGISSTRLIASSWGLTASAPRHAAAKAPRSASMESPTPTTTAGPAASTPRFGKVIEDALRAAGLMR